MNNLTLYDPFAATGFDELFRGFFHPVRAEKAPAAIRMDIAENGDAYIVTAEIPGVAKDDIEVSIEGNHVTIGAEVKRQSEAKDGARVLRRERYSGSVYREFTLPVEVDETASKATFENGVLELKLAKKAAVAGRRLTIR